MPSSALERKFHYQKTVFSIATVLEVTMALRQDNKMDPNHMQQVVLQDSRRLSSFASVIMTTH